MSVRLNKFIADCTGLSRRKADELIAEGKVRVNRKPAEVGQAIHPDKDTVTLDGKRLEQQKKLYVLFYKPPGCITTRSDPEGRRTVYDYLPEKYHHLDPVGRLDRDSSGLLLLTNDGELIMQLTHPRYEHQKVYRVTVNKTLNEHIVNKVQTGVTLEPENKLATQKVLEIIDKHTLVLSLKTGMNRQIRRVFEALGYEVTALKRTAFAGIILQQLRPGESRPLKLGEIRHLTRNLVKPPKGAARQKSSNARKKPTAEKPAEKGAKPIGKQRPHAKAKGPRGTRGPSERRD